MGCSCSKKRPRSATTQEKTPIAEQVEGAFLEEGAAPKECLSLERKVHVTIAEEEPGDESVSRDKSASRVTFEEGSLWKQQALVEGVNEMLLFQGESFEKEAKGYTMGIPWLTTELRGPLRSLRASWWWKDQGWGGGEQRLHFHLYHGEIKLITASPIGTFTDLRTTVGTKDFFFQEALFDEDSPLVACAREGDHLRVSVDLGGHMCALFVKDFTCIAKVAQPPSELTRKVPHRHSGVVAPLVQVHPDDADHLLLLEETFAPRREIKLAEHRAITCGQLERVVDFVEEHCHCWKDLAPAGRSRTSGEALSIDIFNLYHMNEWVIKPATKKGNCAFVELLAEDCQKPDWFISHWWGEMVANFLKCMNSHRRTRRLRPDTAYWVCAYANRQHELGSDITADPSQTSFFRAMSLSSGVLLILDHKVEINSEPTGPATPFTRIWCCYEESVVADFQADGKEFLFDIVAATEEGDAPVLADGLTADDLGKNGPSFCKNGPSFWKTWRESAFPKRIIEEALKVDIAQAKASKEEDRKHILNAIAKQPLEETPLERHENYERVNCYLRASFAVPAWRQLLERKLLTTSKLPQIIAEDSQRSCLKLDLSSSQNDCPAEGLATVVRGMRALRDLELDLSHTAFSAWDLSTLAEALGSLPPAQLHRLSLNLCGCRARLSDLKLAFVARGIAHLVLRFSEKASSEGLGIFGRWLAECGPLETLQLQLSDKATHASPEELQDLAAGMAGLQRLTSCSLEMGGVRSLVGSLRTLVGLRSLEVHTCTEPDARWLFEPQSEAVWLCLEELTLDMKGDGLGSTAGLEALAKLRKLRWLVVRLGWMQPDDKDPEKRKVQAAKYEEDIRTGFFAGLSCHGEGRDALQELEIVMTRWAPLPSPFHGFRGIKSLKMKMPLQWDELGCHLVEMQTLNNLDLRMEERQDHSEAPVLEAVGKLRNLDTLKLALVYRREPLELEPLAASFSSGSLQSLRKLHIQVLFIEFRGLKGLGILARSLASLGSLENVDLEFTRCFATPEQGKDGTEACKILAEVLDDMALLDLHVKFDSCFHLPPALQNEDFYSVAAFKEAVAASPTESRTRLSHSIR